LEAPLSKLSDAGFHPHLRKVVVMLKVSWEADLVGIQDEDGRLQG
jgi:hypothetical protein